MSDFRDDYPKEKIGGGNPYYCCSYCHFSDIEINGEIANHAEWCEWRKKIEKAMKPWRRSRHG
jgi:hypothetical protein